MKKLVGMMAAVLMMSVAWADHPGRSGDGVEQELRQLDNVNERLGEVIDSLRNDYGSNRAAQEAIEDIRESRENIRSAKEYLRRGNFGRNILITARGEGISHRKNAQEACERARVEAANEALRLCQAQYGRPLGTTFTDRNVSNPPRGSLVCRITASLTCSLGR
ncbi:hypothetical protein GW915_03440 [bacterium]|nr:hypothetical protein [bacterium]